MVENSEELKEALVLTERLREVVQGNPWEVHLVRSLSSVQVELERQLRGGT